MKKEIILWVCVQVLKLKLMVVFLTMRIIVIDWIFPA